MAERSLLEYYQKGSESFISISNDPNFYDDNVYVFVIDKNSRIIMTHSIDNSLIGKDVTNLMNVDGINIGNAIVESATEEGLWIEYKLKDSNSNETIYKKLWIKLFEGHIFGAVDNY